MLMMQIEISELEIAQQQLDWDQTSWKVDLYFVHKFKRVQYDNLGPSQPRLT